jgi:CHAD domain-containing protein
MIYRLKVTEPIARGISRVGLEQIGIAQARLIRRNDAATAIHDTRRCLKRLRALLRLVRPALPDGVYRREANRLAGIGRSLAQARDQHVMQQTIAKLGGGAGALPKRIAKQLAKLLANGAGPNAKRTSSAERRQALESLEKARVFFERLGKRDLTLEHLAQGLKRSYRRARRAFHGAYEKPSDEAFHEWRKPVQQHWRHMQLLSRAWPEVMAGRAGEAKELSRLLGEDHDIHVLRAFAAAHGNAVLTAAELESLAASCQSRQDELRAQAKPRGSRLFAEPASGLAQRISCYWLAAQDTKAARSEEGVQPPARSRKTSGRKRSLPGRADQAASRGAPSPASASRGR